MALAKLKSQAILLIDTLGTLVIYYKTLAMQYVVKHRKSPALMRGYKLLHAFKNSLIVIYPDSLVVITRSGKPYKPA